MKRWLIAALLGTIVTILHLLLSLTPFGQGYEPRSMDLWSQIRGSINPTEDILIVKMDEISYRNLNIPLNQAWPRKLHAELLNRLAQAGAKRVVFDVLFLDQGREAKVDADLAAAMKKVPTVLGADSMVRDFSSASGTFKLEEVLLPYKPFMENTTQGLVSFPEDYGAIRRFLVEKTSQTKTYPTLSEAAAGIGSAAEPTKLSTNLVSPKISDFINYYGPAGTIANVSYYQVIDKDKPIPLEYLKDKIIFIGLMLQTDIGPSQKDVFTTPYGRIFGTEIHATATMNLIYKDWIRRGSKGLENSVLFIFSILLTTLLFGLRPLWATIITFGVIILWGVISLTAFINNLFIPGALLVTIFLPLTLLLSALYYYFVTRKSELKMVSAFELYVSPEMARTVAQDPSGLSLGGEKVWATALFTDIAGFTSISENMPAEQVSAMLNSYFTEVMDVVFKNDGTLLKFIGDAVFVIWGAPVKINDHAARACKTALEIQREVEKFNNSKRFPPLMTRIGVHTGPMVVGNLGSSRRFDYTAIGDSVNLASRIEGLNKYFGSGILISEVVKNEVAGAFNTIPVGSIKVSGKDSAVSLYMLLDKMVDPTMLEKWAQALNLFKTKSWDETEKLLSSLKDQSSNSGSSLTRLYEFYIEQIAIYRKLPPPSDWQGEITFDTK